MKTNTLKLILGLLLFGQVLNAQGWELTFDVDSTFYFDIMFDQGRNILVADNGDYLISGRSIDVAGGLQFSFASRISPEGDTIWKKKYFNTIENPDLLIFGIEKAPDEGFYLAGMVFYDTLNVVKIDDNGNSLWSKKYALPSDYFLGSFTSLENGYALTGLNSFAGADTSLIVLLDMEANLVSYDTVTVGTDQTKVASVVESTDQNLLLYGKNGDVNIGTNDFFIQKRDLNGNEIWLYEFESEWFAQYPEKGLKETNDGGNVFITRERIVKLDQNGNFEWENSIPPLVGAVAIDQTNDGGYIITGFRAITNKLALLKTDSTGEILWSKSFGETFNSVGYDVIEDMDGFIIAVGESVAWLGSAVNGGDVLVVKVNSDGNLYDYFVNGRLYNDENLNCVDDNEQGLDRILIEVAGANTFYDFADENGFFEVNLDTGEYEIRPILPNPYWGTCINTPFPVIVSNAQDTQIIDLPLQSDIECPYLEVDVSTPFLRRCFDNTYYVNYCNSGTITAEAPIVTIILNPYVEYQSSSIDLSTQNGDTLEFEIPDLEVGACGSFEILTFLNCDSTITGQTHCVTALIAPDSLCEPLDTLWNGASLRVGAECTGDSIYLFIENIGTNDMLAPQNYIVTEDVIMYNEEEVQLLMGESVQVLAMETNGATWRLEVDQVEGHPGNSNPSVVVEGCVPFGEPFDLYYATIFPEDDGNPFVSMDCQESIGSFDPNDKQGFPKGWDDEHFIERNQDIEYLIRFQNTGTDTAFTVVLKDPISPHLDITTLRPGVSSHSYQLNIEASNILTFTFEDILLPDSTTNEAASHGFVKFKINQKEDLPLGTVIYNQADIFFDFNAAVRTNETFHTVAEPLITVDVGNPVLPDASIIAYPNPFVESTTIKVNGIDFNDLSLQLFDINGRLLYYLEAEDNRFVLKRNGLMGGMYFYRIQGDGALVGIGKIIVH